MIKNLEVSGIHYSLDDKMTKYVANKIGRLDKYMPLKNRRSVRAEVKLMESKGNKNDKYQAEVVLHLGAAQLTASESTLNMYAAIDIVEAKLKNQLRKHKQQHMKHKKIDRKSVFQRLSKMNERDFWGRQN